MAFDHGENFLTDGADPRRIEARTELQRSIEDQAEAEIARRRASFEAMQRRHRQEIDDLATRMKSMFGRTPPEVTVNAMALAVEEAHEFAKLRAAEGKPEDAIADIRLFQAQIQGKEVAFHLQGKDKKASFIDDGKNIFVPGFQDDVALLASLQLAQMRWGVIKVTGTDEFKDRVVQLAAEFDLRLSNEDLALRVHQRRTSPGTLSAPTEQEIAAAAKFREELERQPTARGEPQPTPLAAAAVVAVAREDDEPVIEQADPVAPATGDREARAEDMPPAEFDQGVKAEIKRLKGQGHDKAAISERSHEIEDGVRQRWLAGNSGAPVETQDWITKLQEERREKAAARAAQAGKEDDVPTEPIDDLEPDEEPDLGFGDDDDEFSLDVPSAATVTPEPKKSAAIAARP